MGALTAAMLIDRASSQLLDKNNVKWSRTELLDWLNIGIRQVVALQPHANNTVAAVALVAGSRQTIPTAGIMLLDVIRNMGTNGTTPGRAVRAVSKQQLDAFMPTWHGTTKTTIVQSWCIDMQDQTAFYVYPPSNGSGYVQINYVAVPAKIASESGTIPVSDAYEGALIDYMCARAHEKFMDMPAHIAASGRYMQSFAAQLTGKAGAEQANTPALNIMPRTVEVPGGAT